MSRWFEEPAVTALTPTDELLVYQNGTKTATAQQIATLTQGWGIPGAAMDGVTDDTAALQASLAAVPPYGVWNLPPGKRLLVSGTGSEIFLRTTPVTIRGNGATLVLSSSIGAATDIFHFVAPAGGMRGTVIEGLRFGASDNAPHGRHLIHLDSATVATFFADLEICRNQFYLANVGGSITLGDTIHQTGNSGTPQGGFFHTDWHHNIFSGPINLPMAGDSVSFDRNIITGAGGFYVAQVPGAGNLSFSLNNVTTIGGTTIDGATRPLIWGNTFEPIGTTITQANGAIVDLAGGVIGVDSPLVFANQFQGLAGSGLGGTNAPIAIRIGNCTNARITDNRISQLGSATRINDIVVTSQATNTRITLSNTYWWSALLQPSGLISDAGTLTAIETTDLYSPWTVSAPAVTAGSGALTTASATLRSKKVGKTVFFDLAVVVTTNGTGASNVQVSLPYVTAQGSMFAGRNVVSGKMVQGFTGSGVSTLFLVYYDNTYPIAADGQQINVSGVYETS